MVMNKRLQVSEMGVLGCWKTRIPSESSHASIIYAGFNVSQGVVVAGRTDDFVQSAGINAA